MYVYVYSFVIIFFIFILVIDSQDTITYQLIWQRSFAHPIYRIAGLDLNEDGIEELIVATQYGVHILQVIFLKQFIISLNI